MSPLTLERYVKAGLVDHEKAYSFTDSYPEILSLYAGGRSQLASGLSSVGTVHQVGRQGNHGGVSDSGGRPERWPLDTLTNPQKHHDPLATPKYHTSHPTLLNAHAICCNVKVAINTTANTIAMVPNR